RKKWPGPRKSRPVSAGTASSRSRGGDTDSPGAGPGGSPDRRGARWVDDPGRERGGPAVDPVQLLITAASSLAIVLYYAGIIFLGVPAWQGSVNPDALKYISGAVTGI